MTTNEPWLSYVVCAAPRVGSGHLCDALAGVPGAGSPSEWFGRPMIHMRAGEWGLRSPVSTIESPALLDSRRYLDRVRRQATHNGAVSVKVHWNQIEWCRDQLGFDPLDVVTGRPDVKYIRIYRDDLIAQTVSSLIASFTKVYYRRSGEDDRPSEEFRGNPTVEPRYDFSELLRILDELASIEYGWTPYLDSRAIVPHPVSYEQLTTDLTGTVNRVLEYLGLPARDVVTSALVKQGGDLNREFADRFRRDLTTSGVLADLPPRIRRRCLAGAADVG
ncbi:MAG: Stf0 family sulfotransferase [Stackebrandtia sp.]